MKRRTVTMLGLVVAASSLLAFAPSPSKTKATPRLDEYRYWYHPVGSACPVYYFDPDDADDKANAKNTCETRNKKACVVARGTVSPAC